MLTLHTHSSPLSHLLPLLMFLCFPVGTTYVHYQGVVQPLM